MTTTTPRQPCPACGLRWKHRADCPNKQSRPGPKRKPVSEKSKRILITLPPYLMDWLRKHKSKTGIDISKQVQDAVVAAFQKK